MARQLDGKKQGRVQYGAEQPTLLNDPLWPLRNLGGKGQMFIGTRALFIDTFKCAYMTGNAFGALFDKKAPGHLSEKQPLAHVEGA